MKEEKVKSEYITKEYFNEHLDKRLAENNQVLLGALDSILTKRFTEMREDLNIDINRTQTIIDGYVKSQEDFNQEFSIAKEEIGQIKKVIKSKLGVEIRATG
ncbi:MAG: hypothetical protein WC022_02790 [Parcubacteria group bacterium]